MNRKAFLASLAAVIAAPFTLKAKPSIVKSHEGKMKAAGVNSVIVSHDVHIKGADLVCIINRKRY
jgi:threonine aldolase